MKTYHNFPRQSICIGMRYLSSALLVLFFVGINLSVSAQEEKSTTVLIAPASQADKSGLSDSSASKFTRMQQSGTYGLILLVKVGNLAKIQKNGVLTFTIPGSGESATYKAKKVVAYSESDFTWYGVSADGEALFLCKRGRLTGNFNVRGRSFQLSSIAGESEFSILSERRADLEIKCETEGSAYRSDENKVNDTPSGQLKSARKGVCTEPIRVLVLYTQNAANSVSDINDVIDRSIMQYNSAIGNSSITSSSQTNLIQEAGRQLVTFNTNSPESAPNPTVAAERVRDNANVQSLRNQYLADLVVCLLPNSTPPFSSSTGGAANSIPASVNQYAAVVRADFSADNYTFAHEVGHLLGGRHENDGGGPSYSHGYLFTTSSNQTVTTIMHSSVTGYARILQFSDPTSNYQGTPTGTSGFNYVAKRISEVSPDVVNFRVSPIQPFNAIITGPDNITSTNFYDWELLTFCRDWSVTEWRFSSDGFTYGPLVGAGDAVNNYFLDNSNNGTLHLKCTIVTDQNNSYIVTKVINVNICPGCRIESADAKPEVQADESISVFPNPADRKVAINYSLSQNSDVDVEFVNLTGRSTQIRSTKNVPPGNHIEEFDVSQLPDGLYVCRLKLGSRIVNRSILVSK